MGNCAFDFSIMDLKYGLCSECGKIIPVGLNKCYECEFHKKCGDYTVDVIKHDISEALCLLD